jgi:hypothetical protein
MRKLKKHFVSEIDKKLKNFNDTQPRSASQLSETDKYNKIFELRDNPNVAQDSQGDIWDE